MKTLKIKEKLLLYRIRKNKDSESFAKLYDFYVERIYRFIYFKVSKQEDAQDLCSEVFLKTWQYLIANKKIGNFNALLYKIARHVVIDFYRKKSQNEIATEDEILQQIEYQKNVAQEVENKLEVENIEKYLKRLKDEYREIIILKYVDELSIDEIAKIVNKSKGNVRVIIHRAIKALKELIESNINGRNN